MLLPTDSKGGKRFRGILAWLVWYQLLLPVATLLRSQIPGGNLEDPTNLLFLPQIRRWKKKASRVSSGFSDFDSPFPIRQPARGSTMLFLLPPLLGIPLKDMEICLAQ